MTQATARPWLAHYPAQVSWDEPFPERGLLAIFDEAARTHADRAAIEFFGRRTTYRELRALVRRTACGLQRLGVTKGTRVGLFLPNCPYFVISYFAILEAGGTVVNYNPLYALPEVVSQVEDSGTEIMITLDLAALLKKVAACPVSKIVVASFAAALPFPKSLLFRVFKRKVIGRRPANAVDFAALGAHGDDPAPVEVALDDVAVLQYTGGTTGVPKAAMLTHRNVAVNVQQIQRWFHSAKLGQERFLGVLPLFHVFAMTVVQNYGVSIGATMILIPRLEPEKLVPLIHTSRPTYVPGVPTIFATINAHPDLARYDLSSIGLCISGGAPLPEDVRTRFETLTGCYLVEGYGLSETSPVATCNPPGGLNKAGSIGQPLPLTDVAIRSLDDPSVDVPLGEKGEVVIRGPQVMKGYWNQDEETAQTFVGEWLRTGDVGTLDEQGYVRIVDRIKDVIICSGYNVYPRHLEEAILLHEAVAETTVIGVPDERRGEAPKAFVRLVPGRALSEMDLRAFLKQRLSPIEMPRDIEFRDALPRTLVGKLSKKELVAEERARRG